MENPILSEIDEAELKAATKMLYHAGGVMNVLNCVIAMQKVQGIMLAKLNELIDEEEKL